MHLDRWIAEEGPIRPERAVGWVLRLAKTLHRMHRRGLIHGSVCAHALRVEGLETFQPGELLDAAKLDGDPQYHSLARAQGGRPSEADDVWAAGVTLYFAVTGAVPFPGATDADVVAGIEWLPPSPISEHDCDAPEVQAVLERILSKKRDDPITTARELRETLLTCPGGNAQLPPLEVSERTIVKLASAAQTSSQDSIAEWLGDDEPYAGIIDEHSTDDYLVPAKSSASEPAAAAGGGRSREAKEGSVKPAAGASVKVTVPRPAKPVFDEPAAKGPPWATILVGAGVLGAIAAVYFALFGGEPTPAQPPAEVTAQSTARPPLTTHTTSMVSSRPTASPVATSPDPSAVPTASATAASQAVATAAPSSPPTAAAKATASDRQVDLCVMDLFPADTFSVKQPGFDFLCTESDPTEGALAVRSRLVWAGKGRPLTGGMKEWSQLYWYDMAVFGLLQANCCSEPPALIPPRMTPQLSTCGLQEALATLPRIAVKGTDDEVAKAVDLYTKAVRCLSRVGAASHFGYEAGLTGGEITFFKRFLDRVRQK